MSEQLSLLANNLKALGPRRLAILGSSLLATGILLGIVVLWASRPPFVTLYSGLQRDDINRIGPVLAQAGIVYDIDAAGGSVLVKNGQGSRARMILAEQGLPRSTGSGYELFDNMGSLGLTSFMQKVTRVRAMEGEVARSIRLIEGVRSARVHIVLPDRSTFASRMSNASASVLIQADRRMDDARANAIRQLVASAVPGLDNTNVTVLGADGRVLAAGKDPAASSLVGGLSIQRIIETRLSENIGRMLEPWLGLGNFQVSVRAILDTSERRVEEMTFDPDSRVERSVQVVKVEEANSERGSNRPTSVAEDIPEESGEESSTQSGSKQSSQRREETTNYEINSRKTATVQTGYSVTSLSASVVVNLARLDEIAGGSIDQKKLNERLEVVRNSVLAAAGFDEKRGDIVNVEALVFKDEPVVEAGAADGLLHQIVIQTGSIVQTLAFLVAVILVLLFGLRPAVRMILEQSPSALPDGDPRGEKNAVAAVAGPTETPALPLADRSIESRLQALTDQDEQRAAQVLRSWLNDTGKTNTENPVPA